MLSLTQQLGHHYNIGIYLRDRLNPFWGNSFANEIEQLAQGVRIRMPSGANTIFFIPKDKVPAGRTVTYGRIVAKIRPQKAETYRTRLTVGENLINFPGDVITPTADLITAKLIFNSVLTTKNAKIDVCRHSQLLSQQPHEQI